MSKGLVTCLLIVVGIVNAQIDTTDWYPLHIGNKWEYYGQGFGYSQVKILGDTLMPNGHTYYKFSGGVDVWRFQRKYGNDIVCYYNTADSNEYMLFNFNYVDGKLWKAPFEPNWWGIYKTDVDSSNLNNYPIPFKIFERATIDTTMSPPDTTWGYLIDAYPTRITKGLGVSSYAYDLTYLVGAIINGVGYGTLVGVYEDDEQIINDFKLFQNYPNPFNPTTLIKYQLPKESHVIIKLYDMLGREVTELVNKQQTAGYYEFTFDGSDLASGMYIYKLTAGNFTDSKKLLLVK